jgi:hypothetical protein
MRQLAASNDMNMEGGESTTLEVATKQGLVKTADWKDFVHAMVNCKEGEFNKSAIITCSYKLKCELAIVL